MTGRTGTRAKHRKRPWRRPLVALTGLALTAGALVVLPQMANAEVAPNFWLDKTPSSFGPNELVTITGGIEAGCDVFKGMVRASDIYVVKSGTNWVNGLSLKGWDGAGEPNTIVSTALGGAFIQEIIAITEPAGVTGPGTYDIIEDVCRNGDYDAAVDGIIRNAFTVTIPTDIPLIPDPSLVALKASANAQWQLWQTAPLYLRALGFMVVLASIPQSVDDIVYDQVFGIAGWLMECTVNGVCTYNPFGGLAAAGPPMESRPVRSSKVSVGEGAG